MMEQDMADFFVSKDLDGYFSKVITVNGFGKYTESSDLNGRLLKVEHNGRHEYFEATNSSRVILLKVPFVNFLFSQVHFVFSIRRILRKYDVDFIRVEDPRYNGLLGLYFARCLKKPLIVGCWGNPDTIRNLTGKPMQPRLFRNIKAEKFIERIVFRNCSLAVAQNTDNLNYIRQYGLPDKKLGIFRLGNAINPIHFSDPRERKKVNLRKDYSVAGSKRIIICVSALEKRKIIEDALMAFSRINTEIESHLFLIGTGTMENSYRELAAELKISESVTFTGLIDQTRISQFLAQADLILSPITGRALAEGMLSGTPVVAYNVDCHPDFIESGKNGILVEFRNVQEMARQSILVLSDQAKAARLGLAGRESITFEMNPEKLVIDQIRYFENLTQL
jgi:glycosyltransferase involved in cell wall biosynthesis